MELVGAWRDKSPDGWSGQRKHLETVSSRGEVHHLLMTMVPKGEILRFKPVFANFVSDWTEKSESPPSGGDRRGCELDLFLLCETKRPAAVVTLTSSQLELTGHTVSGSSRHGSTSHSVDSVDSLG